MPATRTFQRIEQVAPVVAGKPFGGHFSAPQTINANYVEAAIARLKMYSEIIREADKPASYTWEKQQEKWGERLDEIRQALELGLREEMLDRAESNLCAQGVSMNLEIVSKADAKIPRRSSKYDAITKQLSTMKQEQVLLVSPDEGVSPRQLAVRLNAVLSKNSATRSMYSMYSTEDGKVAIFRRKTKQKAGKRSAR